ncbi:MAG: helix-turn-helix domain-containing protein [Cyclobacteriaceae bacterium]
MTPFYWYDLIVIPGIIQGVFLAFFLLKNNKVNQSANRILIWILLTAAFMLVGRVVWLRYPADWPAQLTLIADTVVFLFGPLFLLYIKRLLYQPKGRVKLPLYHFLPGIIHLVKSFYYLTLSQPEFIRFLWETNYIDYRITEGLAIFLNLVYWGWGYRLIASYSRSEKQHISYNQKIIGFLRYFQLAIILCLSIWLISYLSIVLLGRPLPIVNYDSVWIAISLFTYVVGYYSLKQPELFRIGETSIKKGVERISKNEIETLSKKLDQLMVDEKPYLKSRLTLSELASMLGTSQNNTSWLLNEVHGKSFYDFINHYRIQEFKAKVSNNEHLQKTILALAIEVGFKSKSTFNKYFQSEENNAPSAYIKRLAAQEI